MQGDELILIVEDDVRLAKLIGDYLTQQGFRVALEERGDRGKERILEMQPDLVILDLMLPGLDGITVCREVRSGYNGPIVMLTARDDDTDQIVGLEIGADDYIIKPVDPRLLLARIRMLLRRIEQVNNSKKHGEHDGKDSEIIMFGGLMLDRGSQTVKLDDQVVDLTTGEFDLLWLLAVHGGKVLDRDMLFQKVRGIPYDGVDRSVDIGISRLRKKLGDDSAKPWRIKTVWGKGYLLVKDSW